MIQSESFGEHFKNTDFQAQQLKFQMQSTGTTKIYIFTLFFKEKLCVILCLKK